jgi:transcriptional regulator with XRE-family HTH domain
VSAHCSEATVLLAIGVELRAGREAGGLTQSDVAKALGYSRASVANAEAGRQDMSVTRLVAWCDLLGLNAGVVVRQAQGAA